MGNMRNINAENGKGLGSGIGLLLWLGLVLVSGIGSQIIQHKYYAIYPLLFSAFRHSAFCTVPLPVTK